MQASVKRGKRPATTGWRDSGALCKAPYEILAEDGSFYAEIPDVSRIDATIDA